MSLGTDGSAPYTPYPSSQPSERELPPPSTTMASWAIGLSLVPIPLSMIVAFVLAIVVLGRCRDGRNHGRKRAIAAIVLVCVWVLAYVALAIGVAANEAERDSVGAVTAAGDVSVYDLTTGDCMPDDSLTEGRHTTVELVPCSEPHVGEVFAAFDLPDGAYPGDDQVTRLSEGGCVKRLEDVTGMTWDSMPYEMFYYYPLEVEWDSDQSVSCVAILPEPQRGMLKDLAADEAARQDASSA